jgi:hypothetical protein
MPKEIFLDSVMLKIYEDTGSFPYNAEDVACDSIRWIENYVRPGHDYDHLIMCGIVAQYWIILMGDKKLC